MSVPSCITVQKISDLCIFKFRNLSCSIALGAVIRYNEECYMRKCEFFEALHYSLEQCIFADVCKLSSAPGSGPRIESKNVQGFQKRKAISRRSGALDRN